MKNVLFLLCLVCFTSVFGSTEDPEVVSTSQTLQKQYNALKTDQEIIDGYRMMKVYILDQFWKTVQDSIQAQEATLKKSFALASKQNGEIKIIKASLSESEKAKEALAMGVDNIFIMGNPYSKAGFVSVVSVIFMGLLVLSVMLFSMSRITYRTTRELRKLNEGIYNEFEAYKHKAVEKQIKLSRELQDYRNRIEELKSA